MRLRRGSMRRSCTAPLRPPFSRSPASAHTAPEPVATIASGLGAGWLRPAAAAPPATGMRATTFRVFGSIRSTLPLERSVAHTAPKPCAIELSPSATRKVRTTFGAVGSGSPRSASAPTATASASRATASAAASRPGPGTRRRTRTRRRAAGAQLLLAQRGLAQLEPQFGHEVLAHRPAPIRSSHRRQPAAHALAHDRLGRVELARDLAVRALVDHVRGDRVALLGRQALHQRARSRAFAEALDARDVLVGELDPLHAQPPPRAPSA